MNQLSEEDIKAIIDMYDDYVEAKDEWVNESLDYGEEVVEKMKPVIEKLKGAYAPFLIKPS